MTAGCLTQLRTLLANLESAAGLDEFSRLCKELLKVGGKWPEEAVPEEGKAFERLSQLLMKFADSQQQDIVAAFRPLREDVRQHMADMTSSLNSWLNEAPNAEKATPQRLAELLQAIDEAPQMRWYKQCTDVKVKAHFLLAVGAVLRATSGASAPLRSRAAGHPKATALMQRLTERFFVIPEHGNVLEHWHDGRLEFYNATLWRAAKRAADRLKDDLQVRLVSALRRATAPVQTVPAGGKSKPNLQLELHQWPMASCPLARAFLDFVAQRGPELGDLGQPALSDCPPHTLLPSTLRRLLGRLDAFEVLDDEAQPKAEGEAAAAPSERQGIVRLRLEALAALAFKAVGTKPKAPSLAGGKPEGAAAPGAAKAPGAAVGTSPSRRRDGSGDLDVEIPGAPATGTAGSLLGRGVDWSSARSLKRLVRRGLRVGDEEWRQAWHQFCKQRRLPAEAAALGQMAPPREVLAEFVEKNLQLLLTKDWSKESEKEDAEGVAGAGKTKAKEGSPAALAAMAAAAARRRTKEEEVGGPVEAESSASESSRSKQRRKRRKREKRKLGMMGYSDWISRGQGDLHISPEVMMLNMNQMMGMSMMMNSPLAMMGMGAPMMTHQMPMMTTGLKMKKEEKGEQAAAAATGAAGASSKKEDAAQKAMIDADDL